MAGPSRLRDRVRTMIKTFRSGVKLLTPIAIGATLLTGCVGGAASLGGPPPITPTERYSLQVEPGMDRIALVIHETGLSPSQTTALTQLAYRFASEGADSLVVEAPTGGDPLAAAAAWRAKAVLEAAGTPSHLIQVVSYEGPNSRAPILAGFETLTAAIPQCGQRWGNLGRTGDNQSSSNFGCAVTANLAAQIANPRDIVTPRAMTPSHAGRRTVVFDNYSKGQSTSAPREALIVSSGTSKAVE